MRRALIDALAIVALVATVLVACLVSHGQQVLSDEQVNRIRQHLPKLLDPEFDEALHSPDMIWYEGSRVYQLGFTISADGEAGNVGMVGLADSLQNISGEFPDAGRPDGFGGNLNAKDANSWPWMPQPGGTARSNNVSHIKGLLLPKRDDGTFWPIVVHRTELEGVFQPRPTVTGTDFRVPVGTKVLELITVDDNEAQQHYVAEIRWRIREPDSIGVEIFRPFPRAADLAEYLSATNHDKTGQVGTLHRHLLDDTTVVSMRLTDQTSGNNAFGTQRGSAFDVRAGVDKLPPIPAEVVRRALDDKRLSGFASALGVDWKPNCAAPTADGFHIVPSNYSGSFLGNDRVSCANCHKHSLASARKFAFANGKYGWLRGNKPEIADDGSLKRGGFLSVDLWSQAARTRGPNLNFQFKPEWDGVVCEMYDPQKHPRHMYFLEDE